MASLAQQVGTEMHFDGVSLNVVSSTAIAGEEEHFQCVVPLGEPYVGCYVHTFMAVRVETELWSPSLNPVRQNGLYGAIFAFDDYGYYPDEPGSWVAVAYHTVETVVREKICIESTEDCVCAYYVENEEDCPFTPSELDAGQSYDEEVLSAQQVVEPTFPCTADGIKDVVISTMQGWPVIRYERGGTVVCQNDTAVPIQFRDSFKELFPGEYTPTNDPCTLSQYKTGAIGGFHSHPLFTQASQMNRGVKCGGATNPNVQPYIEEDIPFVNSANYSFTEPGDYVWPSETGTPSFLLVPNASQIKRLNPGDQFPTPVWSE